MKKIIKPFVMITGIVELAMFLVWFRCTNLQGIFHFQLADVNLQVINLIHTDEGIPLVIVRVLHNKWLVSMLDGITKFTHYFDPLFITSFISLVGMLFFFYASGVFLTKRTKARILAVVLIGVIVFEIVFHPQQLFLLRLIVLGISFMSISLYGNWQFFTRYSSKKAIFFWGILTLISVSWLLFLPSDLYRFCIQP